MERILTATNIDEILKEIENSTDTFFDFSETNFTELESSVISAVFASLNSVSHPFLLRLNYCKFDENLSDGSQIELLTIGLHEAQNMHEFEFIRSLSIDCHEEVLLKIANGLLQNHQIKSITLDGFRVTPPTVCELLRKHPTVLSLVIDGLLKQSQMQFFKLSTKLPSNASSFESEQMNQNKRFPSK